MVCFWVIYHIPNSCSVTCISTRIWVKNSILIRGVTFKTITCPLVSFWNIAFRFNCEHCQYVITRCTKLKGFRWSHNKYLSYLFKCRCYYYSVCSRDPCNIQKVWKQNNVNHKFRSLHGMPVADHIKNLLECRHS